MPSRAAPSRRSVLAAAAVVSAAAGVALVYEGPAQAQVATGATPARYVLPQRPCLYGTDVGGWWTGTYGSPAELQNVAWTRILAGFGAINVVRDWSGGLGSWASINAKYGNRPVIIEVPDTDPTTLGNWLAAAPTDRPIWWCFQHEPESKTDPTTFKAKWKTFGAAHAANSPSNVRSVLILQGSSFIPSRLSWVGGHLWSDWWPTDPAVLATINHVGADVYHFGHDDATADTAEFVLRPVIDAAKSLNKRVVLGEYGMVRTSSPEWPNSPFWSNGMRVQRLNEAIAIFDEPTNYVRAVCYFENDNGSQTNGAPHNMLGPPPGHGGDPYPSQPAALWRAASTR